jgi:hypothetical protein
MKLRSQYRKSIQKRTISKARKFISKAKNSPEIREMEFYKELHDMNNFAA